MIRILSSITATGILVPIVITIIGVGIIKYYSRKPKKKAKVVNMEIKLTELDEVTEQFYWN